MNWHSPKKMSLDDLTDSIVQLCQECNVWSSTINIPHGNGDILDISAACGSQACTPKCTAIFPEEECPNGLNGSYYTFDPSVYGEHSWPDLKSMLMTPGCVSGCKLILRNSTGQTHFRKATHYLRCSRTLVTKDKSKKCLRWRQCWQVWCEDRAFEADEAMWQASERHTGYVVKEKNTPDKEESKWW